MKQKLKVSTLKTAAKKLQMELFVDTETSKTPKKIEGNDIGICEAQLIKQKADESGGNKDYRALKQIQKGQGRQMHSLPVSSGEQMGSFRCRE